MGIWDRMASLGNSAWNYAFNKEVKPVISFSGEPSADYFLEFRNRLASGKDSFRSRFDRVKNNRDLFEVEFKNLDLLMASARAYAKASGHSISSFRELREALESKYFCEPAQTRERLKSVMKDLPPFTLDLSEKIFGQEGAEFLNRNISNLIENGREPTFISLSFPHERKAQEYLEQLLAVDDFVIWYGLDFKKAVEPFCREQLSHKFELNHLLGMQEIFSCIENSFMFSIEKLKDEIKERPQDLNKELSLELACHFNQMQGLTNPSMLGAQTAIAMRLGMQRSGNDSFDLYAGLPDYTIRTIEDALNFIMNIINELNSGRARRQVLLLDRLGYINEYRHIKTRDDLMDEIWAKEPDYSRFMSIFGEQMELHHLRDPES